MKRAIAILILVAQSMGSVHAAEKALDTLKLETTPVETLSIPIQQEAVAAELMKSLQGATAYDKLANLFASGHPATDTALTGWFVGRCVASTAKNTFRGALMMGRKVTLNGGPLFDPVLWTYLTRSAQPNFFDNMTAKLISEIKNNLMNGAYSGGRFTLEFPEATTTQNRTSKKIILEERIARGYIVEHYTDYNNEGKITWETYGYYFKDVTPK
ncbi:MAG: hypothetical protein WCW52_02455 [Elusimicrobiales bacterium]|jgi:hypothetical protein